MKEKFNGLEPFKSIIDRPDEISHSELLCDLVRSHSTLINRLRSEAEK